MWVGAVRGGIPYWGCKSNLCGADLEGGGASNLTGADRGECGLGWCAIVGRIPYWGCKSNLCGADLEGGGASNLTGADRGRMWIGAVSPASLGPTPSSSTN